MLQDVIDGLKLVAESIDNVKTIAEAVKNGREYVARKHPEIQIDLRTLLEELTKSLHLIKRSSAVMTNFRFAVEADAAARDLARFNDYFISAKSETQLLRNSLDDLRTHCSKVREHASRIAGSSTAEGFAKIFVLLGLQSPERERELGQRLDKVAYEDFALANGAEQMLDCLERALREVQDSLGDGGAMYVDRVPVAADLLAQYGPTFLETEERAATAAQYIRALIVELK